jgi:hypothetical protein
VNWWDEGLVVGRIGKPSPERLCIGSSRAETGYVRQGDGQQPKGQGGEGLIGHAEHHGAGTDQRQVRAVYSIGGAVGGSHEQRRVEAGTQGVQQVFAAQGRVPERDPAGIRASPVRRCARGRLFRVQGASRPAKFCMTNTFRGRVVGRAFCTADRAKCKVVLPSLRRPRCLNNTSFSDLRHAIPFGTGHAMIDAFCSLTHPVGFRAFALALTALLAWFGDRAGWRGRAMHWWRSSRPGDWDASPEPFSLPRSGGRPNGWPGRVGIEPPPSCDDQEKGSQPSERAHPRRRRAFWSRVALVALVWAALNALAGGTLTLLAPLSGDPPARLLVGAVVGAVVGAILGGLLEAVFG